MELSLNKPLSGKRIVVTRPEHQADGFAKRIREYGGIPLLFPAICLIQTEQHPELINAVSDLSQFDWVVFTSVNGVQALVRAMGEVGVSPSELSEKKIAAIGPATAKRLEKMGVKADVVPDEFVSEALLKVLGNIAEQRFLLPRADIARKVLPNELRKRGATVREISAYRIVPNADPQMAAALSALDQPDYLTFTSSSTVKGFYSMLEASGKTSWFDEITIASIGPITAETVSEFGGRNQLVASEFTTEGVLQAMIDHEVDQAA